MIGTVLKSQRYRSGCGISPYEFTFDCTQAFGNLVAELSIVQRTVYRRVQRFIQAPEAARPDFDGPVMIGELYVNAETPLQSC